MLRSTEARSIFKEKRHNAKIIRRGTMAFSDQWRFRAEEEWRTETSQRKTDGHLLVEDHEETTVAAQMEGATISTKGSKAECVDWLKGATNKMFVKPTCELEQRDEVTEIFEVVSIASNYETLLRSWIELRPHSHQFWKSQVEITAQKSKKIRLRNLKS